MRPIRVRVVNVKPCQRRVLVAKLDAARRLTGAKGVLEISEKARRNNCSVRRSFRRRENSRRRRDTPFTRSVTHTLDRSVWPYLTITWRHGIVGYGRRYQLNARTLIMTRRRTDGRRGFWSGPSKPTSSRPRAITR